MKTTKTKFLLGLLAIMLLAVGCKKEKTENITTTPQTSASGILQFDSAEKFLETQQKVLAMSETERREWERQQGFKSYATKCEELFEDLEAKGINSDEDIYNFVNENSDYFFIREEEGEKFLSSYYENSPFYYFMNCDQVLAIGDTLIKVFDHYLAKTTVDKSKEINSLKEGVFEEGYDYYYFIDNVSITKEYSCDCTSTESVFRSTDGNNRLYVRFTIGPMGVANVYRCYYKLRPYHRIMGIWFFCSRTIYYDFTVEWKYQLNPSSPNQWTYGSGSASDTHGTGASMIDGYLLNISAFPNTWYNLQFNSFSGWAKTLDTPKCNITCPNLN